MREPSSVNVEILDFSSYYGPATRYMQEKAPDAGITGGAARTLGRVTTSEGIYVLDSEGVGSTKPITEENPLRVAIQPTYAEGKIRLVDPNGCVLTLNDSIVAALPVTGTEPLHEFIRSFGGRLEQNFAVWEQALAPVAQASS